MYEIERQGIMRYLVYSGSNFAEKYVVTVAEVGEGDGGGEGWGGERR